VFAEGAVVWAEGGGEVRINVEFADDFAMDKHGNDDFGPGLEGTGEITWIGIDVIDEDSTPGGGCGAANSPVERDAGVVRRSPFERSEGQDILAAVFFNHVEADPIVASEFFMEERNDALHESVRRIGGFGESLESRKEISGSGLCGHGD